MSEKNTSEGMAEGFIKNAKFMIFINEISDYMPRDDVDNLAKLLDQVAEQSARRAAEWMMCRQSFNEKTREEIITRCVQHAISEG